MPETITITDNRTGDSIEVPIDRGGVDADGVGKLLPGVWFHDPAFEQPRPLRRASPNSTAPTGMLSYRGYPIEQLAEQSSYLEVAYLLIHGELPDRTGQFEAWRYEITHHTFIHENVRKRFMEGFHHDAHPMGILVSTVSPLSTFYPDAKDIEDRDVLMKAGRAAHRQDADARRRRIPPQRRNAVRLPRDNSLDFAANFLSMMWKTAEPPVRGQPGAGRALDVLFILHADHEQNCSTTAMRTVGSAHADPYISTAAAASALYGPRHGGANEAVIRMLTEIGSIDNVAAYVEKVKRGEARSRASGHRATRTTTRGRRSSSAPRVRGLRGDRQEPHARPRAGARRGGAERRLLHQSQALPQRRLLLGAHLPGHGLPR